MVELTNFHIENFKKMCKKYGVDYQLIDIRALWDKSLSAKENFKIIKQQIKALSNSQVKEEEYYNELEKEFFEKQVREFEEKEFKKQFEKRIEEIKSNSITEIEKYFSDYYEHINAFLENKTVNGFVVVGNAGLGKTYNLILYLKKLNRDFVLVKGHITALTLYRILYENRNNQIIILDDIIKILEDKDIINILLGALDYQNKSVEWLSSSPLTSDLPRNFIFNSKIFIITNKLLNDEFFNALKSRCIVYKLSFTKQQIIEMLYIIAKQKGYDISLVDYIKELAENNVLENLDLRLLDKINSYKEKELVKQIIEINKTKSLVYELMKSNLTVKEQVKEFMEKTGLSRRTYFYIKSKLVQS